MRTESALGRLHKDAVSEWESGTGTRSRVSAPSLSARMRAQGGHRGAGVLPGLRMHCRDLTGARQPPH